MTLVGGGNAVCGRGAGLKAWATGGHGALDLVSALVVVVGIGVLSLEIGWKVLLGEYVCVGV